MQHLDSTTTLQCKEVDLLEDNVGSHAPDVAQHLQKMLIAVWWQLDADEEDVT
ncbi:hypothetical protein [Xanthomonas campestris]|uniref:Uncharacterized protein n=1 Tax=Xanthomonas euroxanthea TaxID=2259622 RepID=A0AA46C7Q1_9XANT|nr:hypothetical protein [Xanthomonas campestris]CAE1135352.1 hypothetical protein XTG_001670 [Xanthomonas euroxanthea]MCD0251678.1 hypothetical protein [Xanthomonas campestris pv. campestris]MCD0260657.1 hypothetical protein [Xanthomonas campestris pv. campestris]MCD0268936.1 hypothetical protein [Xanthomonas campestris pv. campestris]MCD0274018.1 hypothetical protein [Xanthomonas campestris pv. campestris]